MHNENARAVSSRSVSPRNLRLCVFVASHISGFLRVFNWLLMMLIVQCGITVVRTAFECIVCKCCVAGESGFVEVEFLSIWLMVHFNVLCFFYDRAISVYVFRKLRIHYALFRICRFQVGNYSISIYYWSCVIVNGEYLECFYCFKTPTCTKKSWLFMEIRRVLSFLLCHIG